MKLNVGRVSEVSLGTPLLAEQVLFATIVKSELKPQKNDSSAYNLVNILKIVNDEVLDSEGKMIPNRNFTLFHQMSLKPSFHEGTEDLKYDPRLRIKELAVACGFSDEQIEQADDEGGFDSEVFVGKYIKIKVSLRTGDPQYQDRNDVQKLHKIKDSDNFQEPTA